MSKVFFLRAAVFAALAFLASGCATARYPFLSPEDQALKARVQATVARYSGVINVSAVDGRIYLSSGSCVEIYGLVETVIEEVRYMDGVKAVFSDVPICGDRDDDWP